MKATVQLEDGSANIELSTAPPPSVGTPTPIPAPDSDDLARIYEEIAQDLTCPDKELWGGR